MISSVYLVQVLAYGTLVSLLVNPVQGICPNQCDCRPTDGGTIVHCKYQRLNGFPPLSQFPQDTIELDYEHNNISVLSSLPSLTNLQRLFLDHCDIHTIAANAFGNAPALTNITLKTNRIATIDQQAFAGLPGLTGLYLEDNNLQTLPDSVFNSLNLVDLYLDGSSIHTLTDNTFSGLSVQHLSMKRNNISLLTAGHMKPLQNSLVSFHLDDNGQNLKIDANTFDGFTNLEALSLRASRVLDIAFLKFIKVKSLYLSGNIFPDLDLRPYLNLASIETLGLSDMGLVDFPADKTLRHLSSLQKLDLSKNGIKTLQSSWFEYTPELTELNLAGNKLTKLPSDLSANLEGLTSLDLSINNLNLLTERSFVGMTKLGKLDLTRNKFQVLPASLKPLFNRVMSSLFLRDNPLHCNCEMKWYREWLDTVGNGNMATQCNSPTYTYIYNLDPDKFECKEPRIISLPKRVYVKPGDDLFLNCQAAGDPAPIVKWVDHYNDSIKVEPSHGHDRTNYNSSLPWQLNSVTPEYSGIYVCTASNVAGSVTEKTEVIVTDNIPSTSVPTTTTTIATTTAAETEKPSTIILTSVATTPSDVIPSKANASNVITTTLKTEGVSTNEAKIDQKTLAIIIGSVGGVLIIFVLLLLIIHVTRHSRHKRRYDVNDKAIIYRHDTNELDMSKDSKEINV